MLSSTHKTSTAILITGSEFSLGLKQDTNSQMIADLLRPYGISISQILIAPDNLNLLTQNLEYLVSNNDFIIISGGLGPTADDLTRFAVAKLLNQELIKDQATLVQLEQLFAKRNRPLYESNKLQALFPAGATIIPNPIGTASGFSIPSQSMATIFCLPGVPSELKIMLQNSVIPAITTHGGASQILKTRTIRLFGLAESLVGEIIGALNIPKEIEICYQTAFPEIQVILSSAAIPLLDKTAELVAEALGREKIFSNSLDQSLEQSVHQAMLERHESLAIAESCTGGLLSALIVSNENCSKYYQGGVVSYTKEQKQAYLGVPQQLLDACDAVSAEVAIAMADGVSRACESSWAISITGFAGPTGGNNTDPVGTFYIGLAQPNQPTKSLKAFYVSERALFQKYASYTALQFLLQALKSTRPTR